MILLAKCHDTIAEAEKGFHEKRVYLRPKDVERLEMENSLVVVKLSMFAENCLYVENCGTPGKARRWLDALAGMCDESQ